MNDAMILNKSKNRVLAHLIFYFIFICAYDVMTYYVLTLDFFANTGFAYVYLGLALAQVLIFLIAFGLLATGQKWTRVVYWFAYLANLALFYVPIHALLQNLSQFLTLGTCLALLFVEALILFRIGMYFHHNPYCRIFYDHILSEEIEQKFMAAAPKERKLVFDQTTTASTPGVAPVQEIVEEEVEEEVKEPLTYPQMAFRLGLCVYGELIVFPILCTLFSSFFASFDLQQVFAVREMFMLCIFSAFIWTIPVFYLYYDQPRSKTIVWGCLAVEALLLIWTGSRLYGYWASDLYPLRAIVLFGLLDLARLGILVYFAKPVLTTPHRPEPIHLP